MKKNFLKYGGYLIIGAVIFLLGFSAGISYQSHKEKEEEVCRLDESFFENGENNESDVLNGNKELIKENTEQNAKLAGETLKSSLEKDKSIGKARILIDYGNGVIDTFNELKIPQDGKVIDLLNQIDKSSLEREYKDFGGSMGVFVVSLGGVGPDDKGEKWWQFWINNEYAKMGISTQKIKDGDVVEFKYIEGQR